MSQLTEKQAVLLKSVQKAAEEMYEAGKPAIYHAIEKNMRQALIEVALKNAHGNQSKAAIALGINRATLRTYAKQVGIYTPLEG